MEEVRAVASRILPIREAGSVAASLPEGPADLADGRIPPRFRSTTLTDYRPANPTQRAALIAVRSWLETLGHGPMLALVGETGTGKSHLLYGAARELFTAGRYPYVRPWYRFVDELRYGVSFRSEGGFRERGSAEVRADWWDAPVVLLDDVRPTSGTEFDSSELGRYACHAYDQKRAVLITTNVHPLELVLGPSGASRFVELVVRGPDARNESAA